jgi:hypothetical protein
MIDIKCSWDMVLSASFLYMQAKTENLEYIQTSTTTPNGVNGKDGNFRYGSLSFDYEPAFKVGLGFNLGCDDWMFKFQYMRYHADVGSGSLNTTAPGDGSTTLRSRFFWAIDNTNDLPADIVFNTNESGTLGASSKWRLELDLIDFDVSRKYYVGRCLTFEPNFGIRAGWIDQKFNVTYTTVNNTTDTSIVWTSNNTTESWAVGLKTGLDTNWAFCGGFYMFGNSEMSILYTDYDNIFSNQQRTLTTTSTGAVDNIAFPSRELCYLRPQFNLGIGLGWSDYFCCNDWFFDFKIGYEMHVFWSQNTLHAVNNSFQDPTGDLYLHGLIVSARLDF